MRNFTLASALVILLVVPGVATAVTLAGLDGSADCDGWSADLTIWFRSGASMARVEYDVVLRAADGTELERFSYGEGVAIPATEFATYRFEGSWATAPDGDCSVTADFLVLDIFPDGANESSDSFGAGLSCDGGTAGDQCAYPARYWAQNPGRWPLESLEVSGRFMNRDQLISVLGMRGNQFLLFSLMREVVAARLNLANGASDEIRAQLAAAEEFLASYPRDRRQALANQAEAMRLRAILHRYNLRGCPDGSGGVTLGLDDAFDRNFDGEADKAAVEFMSLGTVKALYR